MGGRTPLVVIDPSTGQGKPALRYDIKALPSAVCRVACLEWIVRIGDSELWRFGRTQSIAAP